MGYSGARGGLEAILAAERLVRDARDPQEVQRTAQRVIDILSRPYEVDQHTLYIGASIGASRLMVWRAAPKSSSSGEPSLRR